MRPESNSRRFLLAVVVVAMAFAVLAPSAGAARFSWIKGFDDPATPDQYDKVGVLKEGSPFAEKIPTYRVRIVARRVEVNPRPLPPGTPVEPALIPEHADG